MKHINKLLIIRMSALGDVCMTIPIIYLLAEKYPYMKIYVLTRDKFRQLFFSCPSNVIPISYDEYFSKGFIGILKAFSKLREYKFDAVADFHGILRTYILDSLFKISGTSTEIVDKERSKRKRITALDGDKTLVQTSFFKRYSDVLSRLDLCIDLEYNSLFLPLLKKKRKRNCIGIAPFARYYTKTYPLNYIKELIYKLASSGYEVLLFGGGKKEMSILEDISGQSEYVNVVSDKLSFKEQLDVMASLRLMISMDSANMHLASLVNTPVVSIWGGTTPNCGFLGWQQSIDDALCMKIECQPCSISGTPECPLGTLDCMRKLLPDMVYNHILERYSL